MLAVLAVICFAICKEANTCLLYLVAYRDNAVGRIDGILIIHLSSTPLLFLKLRKAEFIQEKDPILGSPFLRETGEDEIVGLPATGSTKLYVLPVKDVHGDGPLGFEKLETAKHFMMVPWQFGKYSTCGRG
jgi:hypothetical protein